jgi:hypothetical protein
MRWSSKSGVVLVCIECSFVRGWNTYLVTPAFDDCLVVSSSFSSSKSNGFPPFGVYLPDAIQVFTGGIRTHVTSFHTRFARSLGLLESSLS